MVLTTQATTKVFKSEGSEQVTQSFGLVVGAGATLAFLPDPVTCFERARYRQTQSFRLAKDANLVFVDWLTSGRKRNYLTTGTILESRKEILEHWDFDEYDNTAEIFVDGERLLTDRVRLAGAIHCHCGCCSCVQTHPALCLADDEEVKLRERMQGMHVLGLMVVVGAKLQTITDLLLAFSSRKRLHNACDITPQGRLATQNDFPGVIASASPFGDGVIARFCGEDAEVAMHFVKTMLAPLRDAIGFSPYQENR